MLPSNLQLKSITFSEVQVRARELASDEDAHNFTANGFDFNGVNITESFNYIDPGEDNNNSHILMLKIVISNEEGKKCPYLIDIEVYGAFVYGNSVDLSLENIEMILINGCSILYGAIREQILSLTARSVYGQLILPTVNFVDKKEFAKEIIEKKLKITKDSN